MKKEESKKAYSQEKSGDRQPTGHELYYTEDFNMEEEIRRIEEDPRLADVSSDPTTLTTIKAELARREILAKESSSTKESNKTKVVQMKNKVTEVEMGEDLSDIHKLVSQEELSHLSPEARELIELGIKAKEASEDTGKVRTIRKRSKRVLLAVAAVIVLSMAASTTGVTSMFKYLEVDNRGEEVQYTVVNSDEDKTVSNIALNEKDAYAQADKFFGMSVVQLFGYRADLEFHELVLYREDMSADFLYTWEDSRIFYSIQSNYNQLSHMATAEDESIEKWEVNKEGTVLYVEKTKAQGMDVYNYMVSYECNNLFYKISTFGVKEEIVDTILKYLSF